jgi:MraZ protein
VDGVDEAWGGFSVRMDEKWRIFVPSAGRHALAGGAVMSRGKDRCVFIFSRPQFDSYRQKVRSINPENIPATAFDRLLYSSVVKQQLDKQGRLTIPEGLRKYASLERDVTVVGLEDRLELWDSAKWEAYQDRFIDDFAESTQGVR